MPRRWSAWIGQTLHRRIAVHMLAAILASSVLLVGLGFAGNLWLLSQQQTNDARRLLDQMARDLTNTTGVFQQAVADLAANPVMTTALLDSRERDIYLKPFLGNYRLPLAEDHGFTLCDFDGQPLAHRKGFPPECFRQSPQAKDVFATEKAQIGITTLERRPVVFVIQPVFYPGTGHAEGYVGAFLDLDQAVANAALADPDIRLSLRWDADAPERAGENVGGKVGERAGDVTSLERAITFSGDPTPMWLTLETRRVWPSGLATVATGYAGGLVLALALAFLIANRMARGLTAPLASLTRSAERIAVEGAQSAPAKVSGLDEVGRLAATFNTMLASLRRAQEGLEAKVALRTRDLRDALIKVEASELRYRALFSSSKVVMMLIDPADGAIIDANAAATTYYGYDAATLTGMRITDLNTLTPDEIAREMRAAQEEERSHFQFRHRLAGGDIRDVEVHAGPIEQGGRDLLYSIVHDVTARTRLEDERRRLTTAIEQCPVSIVITNALGDIDYVNPAFTRITGYAFDEVRGQNPRVLKSGETPDAEYAAMWSTLTSRQPWYGVFHNKTKDDGLYWEQAHISPVVDAQGIITHYVGVKENITERRQTEEAIRQLSRRLQDVLDAASEVAIVATDLDGVITVFNTGAQRMLGYTESEVVGHHTPELFHLVEEIETRTRALATADADTPPTAFQAMVGEALTGDRELREWTYRRKNGERLTVSVAVTPLRSDTGEVTGYLGVAQDVSERKQAEAALKESEERFRSLVEATSDWVWETDQDHRFTWFSPSLDSVLGTPATAIIGTRREDLADDSREIISSAWRQHFEDLAAHRPFRDFRYWMRTGDGRSRWISISGSARFDEDGRFTGYRGVGSDVTERAEAATRLRLLALVVEQSPVSVVITDADGRIEYVNQHLQTVSGWAREELRGRHCRVFASGETPREIYQNLWDTILGGGTWIGELKNRRKDGATHWESVAISPVVGDDGDIVRYVGIKEDVSYRKEAEARLTDTHKLLERQAEQLKRSNAELEQFAYVASHDLRQPLRAVSSYLTLIERAIKDTLDPETKEFMGFALNGAKRMDALIVDLLEYSRIGRKERPFSEVALAEIIETARIDLSVAIREAGAEILVAGGLPSVRGDRVELTRLFQNLIGNAIKYRAPDRAPTVEVGWRDGGVEWIIRVQDNGIGIAAKDYDRAFGVFQRLVGRDQYEGNGIGLAVCRKIAEHHQGRVWIESVEGEGSALLVAFPKMARKDER